MSIGRTPQRALHALVGAGLSVVVTMVACTSSEPWFAGGDGVRREGPSPRPSPPVDRDRLPQNGVSPGPGGPREQPVAQDGGMVVAVLHPDGSVTASGYLVCTPGETMNVGWAIWNERSNREGGMVRTGEDRLYFECTGERQEWTLRGRQILHGGIEPGSHPYTVKTAVGTGSRHDHRDYFRGTIDVDEA